MIDIYMINMVPM